MAYRKPSDSETRLLKELGRTAVVGGSQASWVESVLVETMDDGGMGSLRLHLPGTQQTTSESRTIGAELVFEDIDGIEVIASLFVDAQGTPLELDMWKADYSPVASVPTQLPPSRPPTKPRRA